MKKKYYILSLVFCFASIIYYYFCANIVIDFIKKFPITNIYCKIFLIFIIPITFTIFAVLFWMKYNENNSSIIKNFSLDITNLLTFFMNTIIFVTSISVAFLKDISNDIIVFVSSCILIVLFTYIGHFTVNYFWGLSKKGFGIRIIILSILITVFGWFSMQEVELLAILSILLNTLISPKDRIKTIKFIRKTNIAEVLGLSSTINTNLSDEEYEGKLIMQKILIYCLLLIIYVVIKITQSNDLTYIVYSSINHVGHTSFDFIKFYFKGVDRIFFTALILIVLRLFKSIEKIWLIVF